MTLLEECLEALGAAAQPVSDPALCSRILDSLLLTDTGRIDWNAYTQVQACAPAELPPGSWYIVWSDPEKPILRCSRQGIYFMKSWERFSPSVFPKRGESCGKESARENRWEGRE